MTINGISVLIPLYNGIEFLEESINSVIKQTYKNWETIIGINGYNENSDIEIKANDIIKNLNINNKYDIKVIYYNTKNKSQTLNNMIKDIKYEYIALLDVDDLWLPNKLELQIPFLNDYDVVGTHCQYFGDMNGYPSIPFNDINNYNFFLANPIINSSVILHISNAFWDENTILEDYDLWFKLYHNKKKFYNLSDVLCKHRIHKQSAFNNTNNYAVDDLKNKWFKIIFNINKL